MAKASRHKEQADQTSSKACSTEAPGGHFTPYASKGITGASTNRDAAHQDFGHIETAMDNLQAEMSGLSVSMSEGPPEFV
eukprot:gene3354-4214_t